MSTQFKKFEIARKPKNKLPGQILFLSIIFLSFSLVSGQSHTEKIYQSYLKGDIRAWGTILLDMEREYKQNGDYLFLYDLTISQYGYLGFAISQDKKEAARKVLKKAERNVEVLLKKDSDWPEVLALKGALYGLKIALDPIKSVIYGRKAIIANDAAMMHGKRNAQVWMEEGNSEHYRPAALGGNLDEAIQAYNKSLQLYLKDEKKLENNWLYLNTMVALARAYAKAEKYRMADQTYRRLMHIEPGLEWLREKEYPRFRAKYPHASS